LVRKRDRVELHPENPAFAPIVIQPPEDMVLLGRVIEVRRYLGEPGL
jgi:SOS-response transcriptional repressor LexA